MTSESPKERVIDFFIMLLTPLLIVAPGIVVWQIYNWLVTAQWRPVAVSDALVYFKIPEPRFRWLGLQKISEMVLGFPLSATIFFLWMGLLVGSIVYGDKVRRNRDFV